MAKFSKPLNEVPVQTGQAEMNVGSPQETPPAGVTTNPNAADALVMPTGDPEKSEPNKDKGHPKDFLIGNHALRLGNKRRFLTDALCRALNTDFYLLEVDKQWAIDPIGRPTTLRYTREFVSVRIMFDKFDSMPPLDIVKMKERLAHKNGYRYLYETPEQMLTHDELIKQLNAQKDVAKAAEA